MNKFQNKIDKLLTKILEEEINNKSENMSKIVSEQMFRHRGKISPQDFVKLQKIKNKKPVFEESEVCSECGVGEMHEGVCNECGYGGGMMDEELFGGQKNLDKNKNNKLDKEDFKLLRKGKKSMDEEKEVCSECGGMMYEGECSECGYGRMEEDMDEEMEEGNEFTGELEKARKEHKKEFTVGGKTYPVREGKEKWIQKTKMHKGALHKKLGTPEGEKIPKSELNKLKKELESKAKGDKKLSASDLKLLKQVNLALTLGGIKESRNILSLNENELIDMIEKIVVEEKEKEKSSFSMKDPIGLTKTKKAQSGSKSENEKHIQDVTKKLTDYLKSGSKSKFEMETESFPKGNGELGEMDKKAYQASDAVDEYIEAFSYPGQTNIVFDEIHPEKERIKKYLEGDRTTGNAELDEKG
jgi:ribosomal protein L37E